MLNRSRARKRSLRVESLERRALLAALTLADTPVYSEYEDNVPALVGTMHSHHHDSTPEHPAESAGTHHDPFLPNFAALPRADHAALRTSHADGEWSGLFLHAAADDVIRIHHHVILDTSADVHTVVIEEGGRLEFATNADLTLRVVNLQVLRGGELIIGTPEAPIQGSVEVVFKDVPINLQHDPGQYGNGLVAEGYVRMHGRELQQTFVRLDGEARAGSSQLGISGDLDGWSVGDRVLLPDSRQIFYTDTTSQNLNQYETMPIAGIGTNGITLDSALKHDHLGARDADGKLAFTPHVVNLSRNIVLRSENPAGTRGHTMFMQRADVDVRYVSFENLGRTTNQPTNNTVFDSAGNPTHIGSNQMGRYALHLHHLIGPEGGLANGHQSTFIGNAIQSPHNHRDFQWGLVIHASHYALIADNIVYNYAGAGIVTENGSESFNMISGNFISRVNGTRERGKFTDGREGAGIWLRRPNNYLVDNVVTGAEKAAYAIYGGDNGPGPDVRVPSYPGADPHGPDHVRIAPETMHLLQFDGNEAYASHMGLELWYLGYETYYNPTTRFVATTEVNGARLWHINHTAIWGEQAHNVNVNNAVIIADRTQLSQFNVSVGIELQRVNNVTVNNATVHNAAIGIETPVRTAALGSRRLIHETQPYVIAGGVLRNSRNIVVRTTSEDASGEAPPRHVVIRDVRFCADPNSVGNAQNIVMIYRDGRFTNVVQQDVVEVEGFNGQAGVDFRLFYNEQRPDFVVPQTGSRPLEGHNSPIGAPVAGLTNAETWEKYRLAIGGAVAPGGASSPERVNVPGVIGLAFPLSDHLLPPAVTAIATDAGALRDFITHDGRIVVQGVARAGSQVTLYHDGVEIGTTNANAQGRWKYDYRHTALHRGNNQFTATSHWQGHISPAADPVSVMLFDQAPSIAAGEFSIVENTAVGQEVGRIVATDPDAGDSVRLTIVSGNSSGLFQLDAITGRIVVAKDMGHGVFRGTYDLRVRATDRAGMNAEQTIRVTVLPRVPGEWVTALSHSDFPMLSPQEITFLTPEQLASIPSRDSFLQIPAASRAALTGMQVRGLDMRHAGMIDGLSSAQIAELSDQQIRSLGGTSPYAYLDFARLPASRITALTPTQLGTIPVRDGFLRIPAASRAALSAEQVRGLNVRPAGMIDGLTAAQILQLTDRQVQALAGNMFSYLDFAKLPAERITALTPAQLGTIPDREGFLRIPAAARAALSAEQVRGLNLRPAGMIGGLTATQIAQLSDAQVQSLGSGTFGYLDFLWLPPSRITALTASQLSTIRDKDVFMQISAESRSRLAESGVIWVDGVGVVFT